MNKLKFLIIVCLISAYSFAQEFPSANQIYEKAKKSIAFIYAYDQNRNLLSIGSGFCYTPDGQVVSSYSAVEGAKYIKIKIDGVEYIPISIYKFDRRRDIIVYKVNAKNLQNLNIGNSNETKVGDKVFMMGHPRGYERSILETFVSGKRDIGAGKVYFQLTEGAGCGLIGSPILNERAEVIGILTNKLFPTDNVNFATQINTVQNLLESLDVKNYSVANFFNYNEYPTNYDLGIYYESQGDHTTAIWYYLKSLKDEVTPEKYRRIAYCHEQLENLQAAKDYYRLAKELEESLKENMFRNFIEKVGEKTTYFVEQFGQITRLVVKIHFFLYRIFRDRQLLFNQMEKIGVNSLPLVVIIATFTGAVSAWQAAYQLKGLAPLSFIGGATARAVITELGPVLTGIIIAGRVGASIAAELGTMKVTEQIDALEAMSINPIRYLALPRYFASLTMMPILVILANIIAVIGAYIVSNFFLGISFNVFFESVKNFFTISDFIYGIIKGTIFGGVTALIGCHIGFNTEGGAEGVGLSTIKSFVISSASILILDYVLWMIFF